MCLPTPTIVDKKGPEYRCEKVSDTCLYKSESDYEFEMPCKCGLTPTGDAFCPRVFSRDYTSLYSKALHSLSGNCHTLLRDNPYECLMLNVPPTQSDTLASLLNTFVIETYSRDHHFEI